MHTFLILQLYNYCSFILFIQERVAQV